MRRWVVIVAVLMLGACGGGQGEGVTVTTGGLTTSALPATHTLSFIAGYTSASMKCIGGSAFYNGTEVVIKDESGTVLGTTTSYYDEAASAGDGCVYRAEIANVPETAFYVVELDGAEYRTIPLDYVSRHSFVVALVNEKLR